MLPFYTHPNSPKKFTQHQLFACLVLKNFFRTDYRGVVTQIARSSGAARGVASQLGATFHDPCRRPVAHLLTSAPVRRVLESTIRLHYGPRGRIQSSAVDSTGLECTAASGYFVRRRQRVSFALENRSLSSLSEARPGMRHELPLHPLDSRRSRSAPDVDELVPLLHRCRAFGADRLPGEPTRATTLNRITVLHASGAVCGP